MITLENITKAYDNNVLALKDISIEVAKGQIFGVIGRSGAGKSTLVRCVNLLEKPTSGSVILDKVDLQSLTEQQLKRKRRDIGMIFQHFNLLESKTAFENIALPLQLIKKPKKDIETKVKALAELVGLTDRLYAYPRELSGGQKQRVAIARALANDPKVLLCDEATSALDPETTTSILKLLKEINEKLHLTILLITHEMDVIKTVCDRVAVLDKGCLLEEGSVVDIFANPQTDTTKGLTQKALHVALPDSIQAKLSAQYSQGKNPIARLTFVGHSAEEPLLTTLTKRFDVEVSILQADLELIDNYSLGIAVCQLMCAPEKLKTIFEFLNQYNVRAEVLGYV